jgi:5-methylcytosine-specific restriction endonuclease McrA
MTMPDATLNEGPVQERKKKRKPPATDRLGNPIDPSMCVECGKAPKGKNSYCAECDSVRARAYYQKHQKERKAYFRGRYLTKKVAKIKAARYEKVAEARKASAKKYYDEHREERKAYFTSDRGKEVSRAATLRRKARILKQTEPTSPKWARAQIIERDKSMCYWCHTTVAPEDLHIDHVVPIAKGGSDDGSNVAVTHRLCNLTRPRKYRDPAAEAEKLRRELLSTPTE